MLKTPVIRACCNDRHPRMHFLRHPRMRLSGDLLSGTTVGFDAVALPIKKAVLMKTAFWISYSVKSD
tara:strand:+ start:803 stop:1003 length:201 start_codon:yes stop_codon:yes gene_type:complete